MLTTAQVGTTDLFSFFLFNHSTCNLWLDRSSTSRRVCLLLWRIRKNSCVRGGNI